MQTIESYCDLPDDALLDRFARSGDPEPLEEFIRRQSPFVAALARRMVGNAADADDVMQAVFLVCVKAANRFRSGSDPRAWLATITLNACRDQLRAIGRRRLAHERAGNAGPRYEADDSDAEELRLRLLELPRSDRDLIALRYLNERPLREVAQIVGRPEKTVESRLRRALEKLRRTLTPAAFALLLMDRAAAGEAHRSEIEPLDDLRSRELAQKITYSQVDGSALRVRRWFNSALALVIAGTVTAWVLSELPSPIPDPLANGLPPDLQSMVVWYALPIGRDELARIGLDPENPAQLLDDRLAVHLTREKRSSLRIFATDSHSLPRAGDLFLDIDSPANAQALEITLDRWKQVQNRRSAHLELDSRKGPFGDGFMNMSTGVMATSVVPRYIVSLPSGFDRRNAPALSDPEVLPMPYGQAALLRAAEGSDDNPVYVLVRACHAPLAEVEINGSPHQESPASGSSQSDETEEAPLPTPTGKT